MKCCLPRCFTFKPSFSSYFPLPFKQEGNEAEKPMKCCFLRCFTFILFMFPINLSNIGEVKLAIDQVVKYLMLALS